MEDIVNEGIQKVLIGVGGAVVTGLVTWAGLALRKAARNIGRTELEIALDDLKQALEEERVAKATPSTDDDASAAAHKVAAKKRVEKAKRLKALLDAAGEEGSDKEGGAT